MGMVWATLTTSVTIFDPHRGAALPIARVVVVAIPCGALLFYLLVVRRRKP